MPPRDCAWPVPQAPASAENQRVKKKIRLRQQQKVIWDEVRICAVNGFL
jgi:hypothetical protein